MAELTNRAQTMEHLFAIVVDAEQSGRLQKPGRARTVYEASIDSHTPVLARPDLVAPSVYTAVATWPGTTRIDGFTVFLSDLLNFLKQCL